MKATPARIINMKKRIRPILLPALFFLALTTAGAEKAEPLPTLQRIEIRNALTPLPGLLSGGQPTQQQLQEAASAGYRTIIDLRMPEEDRGFDEKAIVESLGMTYIHLPVAGADAMDRKTVQQFSDTLARAGKGPTMLHCGSGNRIGALFSLKAAWFDGQTAEDALALGLDRGMTRLEPAIREKLGLPPVQKEQQP